MGKLAFIVFFGVLAACVVFTLGEADAKKETAKGDAKGAAADKATVDANCKNSNDFQYEKCGAATPPLCCKTREKCVGPVKPKVGAEMYVCSTARQLSGEKAVKIVIIPLFGMLLDIAIVAFMAMYLKMMENHITKVCIAAIVFSWPLYLSPFWAGGFYAAFLALFVASMGQVKDCPWWAYRLAWVLILFQVVSLFGPYEAFHVPLYSYSKASLNNDLIARSYTATAEKDCNKHYSDYFTVLGIEKQGKDADPDQQYNGLCTIEWLGTVQTFVILQGLVWIAATFVSFPVLMFDNTDGSGTTWNSVLPKMQ
jgi:hypothetical protein